MGHHSGRWWPAPYKVRTSNWSGRRRVT